MKISEALAQQGDAEIDFGGGSRLRVTYRPSSMTQDDLDEMKRTKDTGRIVNQVREQVVQWDLTDDHNVLIPLTKPEQGAPDPLRKVPLHILLTTLIGIQKAQRPDPEA